MKVTNGVNKSVMVVLNAEETKLLQDARGLHMVIAAESDRLRRAGADRVTQVDSEGNESVLLGELKDFIGG